MKPTLQPVAHLVRFERLQWVEDLWDELERRAAWRDSHPGQGKSLAEIAQSLGVRLWIQANATGDLTEGCLMSEPVLADGRVDGVAAIGTIRDVPSRPQRVP